MDVQRLSKDSLLHDYIYSIHTGFQINHLHVNLRMPLESHMTVQDGVYGQEGPNQLLFFKAKVYETYFAFSHHTHIIVLSGKNQFHMAYLSGPHICCRVTLKNQNNKFKKYFKLIHNCTSRG